MDGRETERTIVEAWREDEVRALRAEVQRLRRELETRVAAEQEDRHGD